MEDVNYDRIRFTEVQALVRLLSILYPWISERSDSNRGCKSNNGREKQALQNHIMLHTAVQV